MYGNVVMKIILRSTMGAIHTIPHIYIYIFYSNININNIRNSLTHTHAHGCHSVELYFRSGAIFPFCVVKSSALSGCSHLLCFVFIATIFFSSVIYLPLVSRVDFFIRNGIVRPLASMPCILFPFLSQSRSS